MILIPRLEFIRRQNGKGVISQSLIAKGKIVWKREENNVRFFTVNEYQTLLERSPRRRAEIIHRTFPMEVSHNGRVIRFLCHDASAAHCIAHSDRPNLEYDPCQGTLTAVRIIRPGEELTRDYRDFVPSLDRWRDVEHCASFLSGVSTLANAA